MSQGSASVSRLKKYKCPWAHLVLLFFLPLQVRAEPAVTIVYGPVTHTEQYSTTCADSTKCTTGNVDRYRYAIGVATPSSENSAKSTYTCERYQMFSQEEAKQRGINSCMTKSNFDETTNFGSYTTTCFGPKAAPPQTTYVTANPKCTEQEYPMLARETVSKSAPWPTYGSGENESFYFQSSGKIFLKATNGATTGYRVSLWMEGYKLGLYSENPHFISSGGPIKCRNIKLAGVGMNSSCEVTINISAGQTVDITPVVSGLNVNEFASFHAASIFRIIPL